MQKKYKRRNYFIDRKFQTKFILKFCMLTALTSLLAAALIIYLSQDSTTVAIENTKVTVKTTADFILPIIANTTILVFFASAIAVMLLTIFTSHKIAGPLYRIKKEIEAFTAGDLKRTFQIRGTDQLQDLASSLSIMGNSLRIKHLEIQQDYSQLKQMLKEIEFSLPEGIKQRLEDTLKTLDEKIYKFKV